VTITAIAHDSGLREVWRLNDSRAIC